MKMCKIVPVPRKPVYHILPKNQPISVPSQMPLDHSQILRATGQANVYEVIAGRGDVLLTNQNRFADNSKAPVTSVGVEIKRYYNAKGEEISKEVALGLGKADSDEKKLEKTPQDPDPIQITPEPAAPAQADDDQKVNGTVDPAQVDPETVKTTSDDDAPADDDQKANGTVDPAQTTPDPAAPAQADDDQKANGTADPAQTTPDPAAPAQADDDQKANDSQNQNNKKNKNRR